MKKTLKSIGLVLLGGFIYPFIYEKIGYSILDFIISSPSILFEYIKDLIIRFSANTAYRGSSFLLETIFMLLLFYMFLLGLDLSIIIYKEKFSKKKHIVNEEDVKAQIRKITNSKPGIIFSFIIFGFASAYLLCNTLLFIASTELTNSTMQNIEIVSPYIEDSEYKQLKSTFLQMKTYSEFCDLSNSLSLIAEENNLILKNSSIYQYPNYETQD